MPRDHADATAAPVAPVAAGYRRGVRLRLAWPSLVEKGIERLQVLLDVRKGGVKDSHRRLGTQVGDDDGQGSGDRNEVPGDVGEGLVLFRNFVDSPGFFTRHAEESYMYWAGRIDVRRARRNPAQL